MTQPRKEQAKKRPKEKQPLLPLKEQGPSPSSKLVFQLKTELTRLQERDREWKLMFNMLSHDLKEPLLTLEGFTKLLDQSGLETKDQKRYLKVIREAVHSLHTLIGSLQSIARLYQDPAEFTEVNLKEIFQSVTTGLSEQIQRQHGKIITPEEDIIVRGDPVRLYQIFLNLIANSLKYHKKDVEPLITVTYKRDADFHRISIKDNGVGINEEDLQKLFMPFTRLQDVPTDGMGIGLSIVKRIAESFGGQVLVKSLQNQGTTFTVCLPRDPERIKSRKLQSLELDTEDSAP